MGARRVRSCLLFPERPSGPSVFLRMETDAGGVPCLSASRRAGAPSARHPGARRRRLATGFRCISVGQTAATRISVQVAAHVLAGVAPAPRAQRGGGAQNRAHGYACAQSPRPARRQGVPSPSPGPEDERRRTSRAAAWGGLRSGKARRSPINIEKSKLFGYSKALLKDSSTTPPNYARLPFRGLVLYCPRALTGVRYCLPRSGAADVRPFGYWAGPPARQCAPLMRRLFVSRGRLGPDRRPGPGRARRSYFRTAGTIGAPAIDGGPSVVRIHPRRASFRAWRPPRLPEERHE